MLGWMKGKRGVPFRANRREILVPDICWQYCGGQRWLNFRCGDRFHKTRLIHENLLKGYMGTRDG
jgi:hypothetical protein